MYDNGGTFGSRTIGRFSALIPVLGVLRLPSAGRMGTFPAGEPSFSPTCLAASAEMKFII